MKKGWLNHKDGYDPTARGAKATIGEKSNAVVTTDAALDGVAAKFHFLGLSSKEELCQVGDIAAEKGLVDLAADYYTTVFQHALTHEQVEPAVALASHVEALLKARCFDDARHAIAIGAKHNAEKNQVQWKSLSRRCDAAMQEAVDQIGRLEKSPGAPPIPALLQLLRSGIYDPKLWGTLTKHAIPFFNDINSMFEEIGAIVPNGILTREHSFPGGLRPGEVEVILFPDAAWQGGLTIGLPRNLTVMETEAKVAELQNPRFGPAIKFHSWGGTSVADGLIPKSFPWACARHGAWLRTNSASAPSHASTEKHDNQSFPELRCPAEMVSGAVERTNMERAVELVQQQMPVVVASAHLLPAAEEKWSAEFFENSIPSDTADASKFSVYRTTSMNRVFRYAGEATSTDIYDAANEQQADRVYMSFSEFAQKKRACAAGEGDGWAYYLWGVALRLATDGNYEGYNFGQTIDEDLIKGNHWEVLEKIGKAGRWGQLKQAQIFIGCRNALTPCHFDLVHNAYAQVRGWKRFILFDPNYYPCLYPYPVGHPMDRCARVNLESPDYTRFPKLRGARAMEAVLGPGDMLVIPAGWWHHVQTLTEDSVSVSFWFERHDNTNTGVSNPLSPLDRILLAREVERVLAEIVGAREVRGAFGQLRGMPGGDAPKPNPEQVLPCCFLLWRLTRVIGPASARRFAQDLADDERFASLSLRKTGKS